MAKEDLRFIYQDSTGTRRDENIAFYKLDEELAETEKPTYNVQINLSVFLSSRPQDITWFSLHILNKKITGRVDMRWDFRKDYVRVYCCLYTNINKVMITVEKASPDSPG